MPRLVVKASLLLLGCRFYNIPHLATSNYLTNCAYLEQSGCLQVSPLFKMDFD
jgi:hypothetical protein